MDIRLKGGSVKQSQKLVVLGNLTGMEASEVMVVTVPDMDALHLELPQDMEDTLLKEAA